MRLKSYFAGTVESAISLARQEMGEDAMLVNSRRSTAETRHLGTYEVVFATSQASLSEAFGATRETVVTPVKREEPAGPTVQSLAQEVTEIRHQLSRITAQVSLSSARRKTIAAHPALHDLGESLAQQEVSGDLACSALLNLESLGANATAAEAQSALRKELHDRINVAADFSEPAVVALVGPPGVGKTAMIAKLAVRHGLAAKRSTHLISYDGHRIASGEQLRAYAAILGVGFEALDSISALQHSLTENARKDLILIDTPGYGAGDFELSTELSGFLSTYPRLDTHLVLSCAAKTSDLFNMVERFKSFAPAKLLFTRLDETESFGGIVSESVRTGLPLSFLSTGPRVPDDLETATKDRIVDLLLGGRKNIAVARA